jgi:hypothetical protein
MRRCPGRRAAASLLRASPQPTGLPPARPRHTHAHTRTRTRPNPQAHTQTRTRTRTRPNPHAHWCARDRCRRSCRTSWRRWASRWCARCRRTCWSASRAAPTAPSFRIRNGSRPKGVDRRLRAAARPSIHPSTHAPPRPVPSHVTVGRSMHGWMPRLGPQHAAGGVQALAGASVRAPRQVDVRGGLRPDPRRHHRAARGGDRGAQDA